MISTSATSSQNIVWCDNVRRREKRRSSHQEDWCRRCADRRPRASDSCRRHVLPPCVVDAAVDRSNSSAHCCKHVRSIRKPQCLAHTLIKSGLSRRPPRDVKSALRGEKSRCTCVYAGHADTSAAVTAQRTSMRHNTFSLRATRSWSRTIRRIRGAGVLSMRRCSIFADSRRRIIGHLIAARDLTDE